MNQPPPNAPNTKSFFCPACSSASIEVSVLAGGQATCKSCNWIGRKESLTVFHFSQDLGSPEEVAQAFVSDITRMFAKEYALPLLRFISKWGFIDANRLDPKIVGRYIERAARAAAVSILRTREELEIEKFKGPRGKS